eukprot:CAMPEP_0116008038 /NCGR_PEP_ID=MMETSP0321-20121206/2637_1 /TAXON_ID=163516 /ORGANISM="Leptocylindrus danicus var. danicus, Strain B650" /LENGTH=444 /DNA_ID=CAMNT_0003476809 /DNA_START=12 /DNA_END=1346 /DNA_ORIENTATION=+
MVSTRLTLPLLLSILYTSTSLAASSYKSHDAENIDPHTTRRVETLDYWDEETLAYALGLNEDGTPKAEDTYLGHDAAVLFYAQWCNNCHSMAPMYQRVSQVMEAGTKKANFVMALFDCEGSATASNLCSKAGVTHYPTIMFIGAGTYHDTDLVTGTVMGKDRSAGRAGHAPLPRTVKFQGDWRYGEEIRDWIYAMKGLSSWHKVSQNGFLKWLRGGKKLPSDDALPVGVSSTHANANGDFQTQKQVRQLQSKVDTLEQNSDLLKQSAEHAAILMDAVLFYNEETEEVHDPYAELAANDNKCWENGELFPTSDTGILRSCTMDLSLDYCSRVANRIPHSAYDGVSIYELEDKIYSLMGEVEPFCALVDQCVREDFKNPDCRPEKCPFVNQQACTYIATCMDEGVVGAYRSAMEEDANVNANTGGDDTVPNGSNKGSSSGGGWGFA